MNQKTFESKEEKEEYITVHIGDATHRIGAKAPTDPNDRQTRHFGE